MTPAAFLAACTALRWSRGAVARWCGYNRRAGDRWANGTAAVPDAVAAWLATRLAGRIEEPPGRS